MLRKFNLLFLLLAGVVLISSCSRKNDRSSATGWKYNDEKWGGFQKLDYKGQITGPNLVPIEGGTFTMGVTAEDVMSRWDAVPRRVTVSSFYIDETEVSNTNYREFIYWTTKVHGASNPDYVRFIKPDTMVWREELAYNEPFVENYFRHPSYDEYPVVGVTWEQAQEYCKWRTDRVNEMLLIEKGVLNFNPDQAGQDNFVTESYLQGKYEGSVKKNLKDKATGGERSVNYSDGILLPSYRLPTEAEWEYAALGLQGKLISEKDEVLSDRRMFPWDGAGGRYKKRNKYQGKFLANFKKKRGDYMGVAGKLNDNASIPGNVRDYYPNDYGLYNMAGNVNEWVEDVYRPTTSLTLSDVENQDMNPFRGNVFTTTELDENGQVVERDSLGRIKKRLLNKEDLDGLEGIDVADARNYQDGDEDSGSEYIVGENSLISDKSRVIKGGSWADRLYWLSPGTRRFMDQDKSSRAVGFRCAMTRNGTSFGDDKKANSHRFKRRTKSIKRKYK